MIPYNKNSNDYNTVSVINTNYSNYETSLYANPNNALVRESNATKLLQAGQYKFEQTKPAQGQNYSIAVKNKNTHVEHYYTFKLNSSRSWFYFVYLDETSASLGRSYDDAIDKCGGEYNLPTQREFTDSLYINTTNIGVQAWAVGNGFVRGIGNLTSEWGKVYYYAPAHTPADDLQDMMADTFINYQSLKNYFGYWYYWTKDAFPSNTSYKYAVGSVEGNIQVLNANAGVICVK